MKYSTIEIPKMLGKPSVKGINTAAGNSKNESKTSSAAMSALVLFGLLSLIIFRRRVFS